MVVISGHGHRQAAFQYRNHGPGEERSDRRYLWHGGVDGGVTGMTDDPSRRKLLEVVAGVAATTGLAGCTVEIGDYVIDSGAENSDTQTPTYGYGGSPTPTDTAGSGDGGDTPTQTPGATSTAATTPTEPATSTASTSADEYGLQGYGQFGYGG